MMAVRLSEGSAAARKAERGATSMFWEQARRTRNVSAKGRLLGMEMRARQIAEGRCVKTMVWEELLVGDIKVWQGWIL